MVRFGSSHHARSIVATMSLGMLVLAGAGCGSDGAPAGASQVSQVTTDTTVAITNAPTTSAPTTSAPTTAAAVSALPEAEATALTEKVIAAWNAVDVPTIEEVLGATGVYIAINGSKFDASRVHKWLDPMLPVEAALGATSRTGDPVAMRNGFYFPLVGESGKKVYFVFVTRSPDGVLTIQESSHVPLADG